METLHTRASFVKPHFFSALLQEANMLHISVLITCLQPSTEILNKGEFASPGS
jgi:hypothetical protein